MKKTQLTLIFMILTTIIGFGQTAADFKAQAEERERLRQQEQDRDLEKRNFEERERNLRNLTPDRAPINGKIKRPIFIKELWEEQSLSVEDRAKILVDKVTISKFANLLSQKNIWLIKILLDPKCGSSMVIDINDTRCSQVFPLKGNGAYYSFRIGSHAESAASDIYYADGKFQVGFKNELLGVLVELGNVPIESLDKNNKDIKSLKDFKIPNKVEEVKKLKNELNKGFSQNERIYSSNVLAKLDTTYLIRSVAYLYEEQAVNDYRTDVLLTFRVVKKDDESVVILWKKLNEKDSQRLK